MSGSRWRWLGGIRHPRCVDSIGHAPSLILRIAVRTFASSTRTPKRRCMSSAILLLDISTVRRGEHVCDLLLKAQVLLVRDLLVGWLAHQYPAFSAVWSRW